MSFYYVNNIEDIGANMFALEVMDSSLSPLTPEETTFIGTREQLIDQFINGNLHDMNGKWLKTKQKANKYLKDFEV